jgi:hypothetical protein
LTNKTPSDKELKAIVELTTDRNFAQLQDDIGNTAYAMFLGKYTLQVGLAFEGTSNDREKEYNNDSSKNKETNVSRADKLYDSEKNIYIKGIGTSGGLDNACLAFGCGVDSKQREAADFLSAIPNNKEYNEYLFFPIDIMDFSRGATTGADFINKINNENYWNTGLLVRSHLMFDPVGSYGVGGNNNDLGLNFKTPENIIAIQINAKNENRYNFPLQSLSNPDGTLNGKYWKEITLPGSHSDIGGGNAKGEQGKDQQIAFYSLQTMISEASKYGIKFKEVPINQRPDPEFNYLMDFYNQSNNS